MSSDSAQLAHRQCDGGRAGKSDHHIDRVVSRFRYTENRHELALHRSAGASARNLIFEAWARLIDATTGARGTRLAVVSARAGAASTKRLAVADTVDRTRLAHAARRTDTIGLAWVRLHLTRTGEESGTELVKELCRRCKIDDKAEEVRFLVSFSIDKELPLIGPGEDPAEPTGAG